MPHRGTYRIPITHCPSEGFLKRPFAPNGIPTGWRQCLVQGPIRVHSPGTSNCWRTAHALGPETLDICIMQGLTFSQIVSGDYCPNSFVSLLKHSDPGFRIWFNYDRFSIKTDTHPAGFRKICTVQFLGKHGDFFDFSRPFSSKQLEHQDDNMFLGFSFQLFSNAKPVIGSNLRTLHKIDSFHLRLLLFPFTSKTYNSYHYVSVQFIKSTTVQARNSMNLW
jgi:hypothetical protein